MSDKKIEEIQTFAVDYDSMIYEWPRNDDGSYYKLLDVHESIKKSIDHESIEMIKADLVAYFGVEL